MCVVSRARNLSLAKFIVRLSGGSLRATDAMSRADHARRGDESHRLTCLPRRSGEASPFRFLSSGLSGFLVRAAACLTDSAASPGLHAFAVPVMAQTSVTLPSSTMCLASDAIFTSFKIENAWAFKAVSHCNGYKLNRVDADMQDRVGTLVDTASSHFNSSSSRPGGIIPGTLTNLLTVFRKTTGFRAQWRGGALETLAIGATAAPLRTGVNCLPYGLPMLAHGATRMEAVKHATEDRTVGKAGSGSGRQARRLQGRVWKVGRCIGKSFKAGKSAMTGSCATGRLSAIR